jgi:hypothetical protein
MVIDESTKHLFVDGGFAKNEEYMQGLREGFSGRDVRAAKLPHASALGAAMIMKNGLLIFFLSLAGSGLLGSGSGASLPNGERLQGVDAGDVFCKRTMFDVQ